MSAAAQEAFLWVALFLVVGGGLAWLLGPFADACMQVEKAFERCDCDTDEGAQS